MKFSFEKGLETEKIYDDAHNELALGGIVQIGRTGAGGSVYQLSMQPNFCVKVFNSQGLDNAAKRARIIANLKAMLEMPEVAVDPRVTWPLAAVYGQKGEIVGYVMRRVPAGFKALKVLFGGEAAVKRAFPNWTRRELAVTAKNLVDVIVDLERCGVFVADFNPENFLVNASGEVRLIDCDSFMFYGRNGEAYTSDMFFADNAAPEILREPRLAGEPRSPGQSAFSATVLAFQLLMLGQHPFSYVNALDGRACGTPRENILAGTCPLGKGTICRQDPRWFAPWSWLTQALKRVFVRTFRDGHSDPSKRVPLDHLSYDLGEFISACGRDPKCCLLMPTEPKRTDPPQPVPGYGAAPAPRFQSPRPFVPHERWGQRAGACPPRYTNPFNHQYPYRAFGGGR